MSALLAFVSFLCATLVLCISPVMRTRSTALFCLAIWLVLFNAVQGVSALGVRSAAWDEISSRISFASVIAIPTCCFVALQTLALLASSRSIARKGLVSWRIVAECFVCVILPLSYVFIYPVVRSSTLVLAGYGLVPSLATSVASLLVAGVAPLVLCLGVFALLTAVIVLACQKQQLDIHGDLWTWHHMGSMLMAATLPAIPAVVSSVLSIFALSSAAGSSDMSGLRHAAALAQWWTVPVTCFILVLVIVSDMEAWTSCGRLLRNVKDKSCRSRKVNALPVISTSGSLASVYTLQSGWDDSFHSPAAPSPSRIRSLSSKIHSVPSLQLDCNVSTSTLVSSPFRTKSSRSTKSSKSPSTSTLATMSASGSSSEMDADASFASSTLTYLGSPTGQRALSPFSSPTSSSPITNVIAPPPPALSTAPPTPTFGPSSPERSFMSEPMPPLPRRHEHPQPHYLAALASQGAAQPRKDSDVSLISGISGISAFADGSSLLSASSWPAPPAALPPALAAVAPFAAYQPGDALPSRGVSPPPSTYSQRSPDACLASPSPTRSLMSAPGLSYRAVGGNLHNPFIPTRKERGSTVRKGLRHARSTSSLRRAVSTRFGVGGGSGPLSPLSADNNSKTEVQMTVVREVA